MLMSPIRPTLGLGDMSIASTMLRLIFPIVNEALLSICSTYLACWLVERNVTLRGTSIYIRQGCMIDIVHVEVIRQVQVRLTSRS